MPISLVPRDAFFGRSPISHNIESCFFETPFSICILCYYCRHKYPPSHRRKPIIHKQMRPVDEACLVAGQEQGGLGDLHRFADAALGGGDGGL